MKLEERKSWREIESNSEITRTIADKNWYLEVEVSTPIYSPAHSCPLPPTPVRVFCHLPIPKCQRVGSYGKSIVHKTCHVTKGGGWEGQNVTKKSGGGGGRVGKIPKCDKTCSGLKCGKRSESSAPRRR